MLSQVVFAVFLIFKFSESLGSSWNPCPALRSTFQGISMDARGQKRPNCVCRIGLFGDLCQFKVYVASSYGKKHSLYLRNSHQPEHNIYPLEYLNLHHYPNNTVVIKWRHAKISGVQHYVLQFRELSPHDDPNEKPWRVLDYVRPRYFDHEDLMLYKVENFYDYATYEMNLGIVSNDSTTVSVSVIHDSWKRQAFQYVQLDDIMFSASVTWSTWSTWGTCETQYGCGKGKQRRSRVLVTGDCARTNSEETRPCKLKTCPVDGGWSPWSTWSQCSVTCSNGTRSRRRACTSPPPRHGGVTCFGLRHMDSTCVNEACSEYAGVGEWSILEKLKNLDFTSIIVGFAAGFALALLLIASPHLLKRCARNLKERYSSFKKKKCNFPANAKASKPTVSHLVTRPPPPKPPLQPTYPPYPPPFPPPPPTLKWTPIPVQNIYPRGLEKKPGAFKQTTVQPRQIPASNDVFLEELLKAFQTFKVDANKRS